MVAYKFSKTDGSSSIARTSMFLDIGNEYQFLYLQLVHFVVLFFTEIVNTDELLASKRKACSMQLHCDTDGIVMHTGTHPTVVSTLCSVLNLT